ncbi:hypothetical protein [Rhizobacter fulvus]
MSPTPYTNNTNKVLSRYIKAADGTTLVLNYQHREANGIRSAIQRIRLTGDKTPSLALIARRSISVYLAHLESSPTAFANEVAALEKLATRVPDRQRSSTKS